MVHHIYTEELKVYHYAIYIVAGLIIVLQRCSYPRNLIIYCVTCQGGIKVANQLLLR